MAKLYWFAGVRGSGPILYSSPAMNESLPSPLAGIRVIDLATSRAELAGRLLADLGAEVIKIEPPSGAEARLLPPFVTGREGDPEASLYWAAVSLGKKSVVLDLDDDGGRERLKQLLGTADILIESFDPGRMAALGLGFNDLKGANPGLVYVSVTPYGAEGPHAGSPATDLTLEAAGGLLGLQGDGGRPPVPVGYPQASFHSGVQAAVDAIIALNARAQSGRGQHLDLSMQEAMVWTLMNATGYPPNTGGDPPNTSAARSGPPAELAPGVAMPGIWPCRDGWVQMSMLLSGLGGRTLANLMLIIANEGALSADLVESGWLGWLETMAPGAVPPETLVTARDEIGRYFLSRTKEELMARAVEHKLLLAPIRTVDELLRDPQLAARDYFIDVAGRKHPGLAARLSRTPMALRAPAPRLGEHQQLLEESRPSAVAAAAPRQAKPVRPFEGLKVADFAWVGVGPLIAKALADHGATVVHVESATRPDVLRLGPPFKDGVAGIDRSQFQANFNSSKIGLALDLAQPGGQELARQLIDWADVVLESFVPGVVAHFGFGYADLAKERPDLIMLSTCLEGQTGPYATYRGFGTQGAALSGLHGLTGWPDRAPKGTWGAYTDFIAPRYGIAALTAAIFERRTSGLGQHIDLGQVEAAIHFVEPALLDYTVNGHIAETAGHRSAFGSAPHGVYPAEGIERYIAIEVATEEQWRGLCSVIPMGRLAGMRTADKRRACSGEIDGVIAGWTRERDAWAVVAELADAGVPAAVVQRPSDLYEDAQLASRGFFVACEHSVMGPTPYDGPATHFSETPAQVTAGPCLGEHTESILREILGLSDDEIAAYAGEGVFS